MQKAKSETRRPRRVPNFMEPILLIIYREEKRKPGATVRAIFLVRCASRASELLVDHAGEGFERLGTGKQPSVDEEGRRAGHP